MLTKCSVVGIIVMNNSEDCGMSVEIALISEGRSENKFVLLLTFKRRIKSHLPFAGIIRSSPYSPR